MIGKLLIDDYPIQVLPRLACEVGLNEAIFLQQLHYWIQGKNAKSEDGRRWVYNTYDDWLEQFPFWSKSTIRRMVSSLEEKGFVITSNFNKMSFDRTKWYSIDYELLNKELFDKPNKNISPVQNEQLRSVQNEQLRSVQNEPNNTIDYHRLPETTTETTKKTLSKDNVKENPFPQIEDDFYKQKNYESSLSTRKKELIEYFNSNTIKDEELTTKQKNKIIGYSELVADKFIEFNFSVSVLVLEYYLNRVKHESKFELTNRIANMNVNFLRGLENDLERIASLRQSIESNYKGLFKASKEFLDYIEKEEFKPPPFGDGKPENFNRPSFWKEFEESVDIAEREREENKDKELRQVVENFKNAIDLEVIDSE